MIQLTTSLTRADEDLNYGGVYYTVFPIPAAVVAPLLAREHNASRVIVTINGRGNVHGGLMPDGKGDYFLTVSKELRRLHDLEEGDEVRLTLRSDDSAYGMALPEEIAELWSLDEEAREVFHRLTPGKQRSLIYQVAKAKRPDTRVRKAVQIHEYLKSVDGKLDYRELNAYVKADNANWG